MGSMKGYHYTVILKAQLILDVHRFKLHRSARPLAARAGNLIKNETLKKNPPKADKYRIMNTRLPCILR